MEPANSSGARRELLTLDQMIVLVGGAVFVALLLLVMSQLPSE